MHKNLEMEADTPELDSENELITNAIQSRNIRKNIPLKKDTSKNRGRPHKTCRNIKVKKSSSKLSSDVDEEMCDNDMDHIKEPSEKEPLHRNQKLKWDYKVNLVGEKVVDPRIHSCEKCSLPILIYGRMIPCKHVFCFDCAKKTDQHCPRCSESVQRIEQSALGTVFMCTFAGNKHGNIGCRRTYLSQRDLQAHINHRHLRSAENQNTQIVPKMPEYDTIPEYETRVHNPPLENMQPRHHPPPPENMMYQRQNEDMHLHQNHPIPKGHNYSPSFPVMNRTNLITVPIQDDSDFSHPERTMYKPPVNPPLQPHSPSPATFPPAQPTNCNPHPGQPHCPPPMAAHISVPGPPVSYASALPMNPSYSVPPMQPTNHAHPIRPHGPIMASNQGMYSTMAPGLHPVPSGPVSAPPPPPPPHHVVPVNHNVMQPQPHQPPHPQPHQHPQSHQPPHQQPHQPHGQQPHPQSHQAPIRYDPGPLHMNPRHPPNFEEHLSSPPYNQSNNISPWTPNMTQPPPPQRNLPPANNPSMGGSASHIPPDKNVYRPYYQ